MPKNSFRALVCPLLDTIFIILERLQRTQNRFSKYVGYKNGFGIFLITFATINNSQTSLKLNFLSTQHGIAHVSFSYKLAGSSISLPPPFLNLFLFTYLKTITAHIQLLVLTLAGANYGKNNPINRIFMESNTSKLDLFFICLPTIKYL